MQRRTATHEGWQLLAVFHLCVIPAMASHEVGANGATWRGFAILAALVAVGVLLRWGGTQLLRWSAVAIVAFTPPIVDSARSQLVTVVLGAVCGTALSAFIARDDVRGARAAMLVFGGLASGVLMWSWLPRPIVIGVAVAVVGTLAITRAPRRRVPLAVRTVGVAAVVVFAITAVAIGATSPRATWLGRGITHGPRSKAEVALTFDDGPNLESTMAVRNVLDSYGVKGTFFVVGSALDAAPDIERSLLDDGQLLGSHAYHHNTWRWIAPGYGELSQSLRAMKRDLGICPTFFRPPHGFHTPFMSAELHKHNMRMVMWDVSASDWATTDADLVAHRVLSQARAGSIILLHDGLDGRLQVDRSVVVRALPQIIDGLRARGLEPVRLDALLGQPAYAGDC